MIFWQVLFWLCVLAIAHTYVLYPWLLGFLAKGKKPHTEVYAPDSPDLPLVTIFMAVYNEEKVLADKLQSIFACNYPPERLQILIGSDSSTDGSHAILDEFAARYPRLRYEVFSRRGKAKILNALYEQAQGEVFIYTDANVIFHPDLIYQLVKHFKNPKIGQVGARFINQGLQADGISTQESAYIARETRIKEQEGRIWGSMMGAFGGCHAIRGSLFTPNPDNFLMEDFYISLHILAQGYWAILEPQALVYEDVPNEVSEEFKRKVRISAGNFQNLGVYYGLLFPPFRGLAFSFLSHKVLRWLGPFFLGLSWLSLAVLGLWAGNLFYLSLLIVQTLVMALVPPLDAWLKRRDKHWKLLRYASYFLAMNLALFQGFITYIKGVRSNVWQPTKRSSP